MLDRFTVSSLAKPVITLLAICNVALLRDAPLSPDMQVYLGATREAQLPAMRAAGTRNVAENITVDLIGAQVTIASRPPARAGNARVLNPAAARS
jgi:hypothetical protein